MKVKFKKIEQFTKGPTKAHQDDAGFDLYASSKQEPVFNSVGLYIEYGTGICFEIPKGYVGLLFPRSSISDTRHNLRNSVGVIDSGYRGEVKFRFSEDNTSSGYSVGDKIGQVVFIKLPKIDLEESFNLSDSSRNEGGFGSSGK
jgi:dUTP pyrophosphatase